MSSPVIAIDFDGFVRPIRASDEKVIRRSITFREDEYPTLFHRPLPWKDGSFTMDVEVNVVAVEWIHSLIERSIEVVWATTWQRWANFYFADLIGIDPLPVAVPWAGIPDADSPTRSPEWKALHLARQFDGRPLLWGDDNPTLHPAYDLAELRREEDRDTTAFLWTHPIGLTAREVSAVEAWLDQVS